MRQKAEKAESQSQDAGDARDTGPKTAKAARQSSSAPADTEKKSAVNQSLTKLRVLEQEVMGNKEKVNNLVALLQHVVDADDRVAKGAIHALRRLFTCGCASLAAVSEKFMSPKSTGDHTMPADTTKPEANAKANQIYNTWVCKQYAEFKRLLVDHLHHKEGAVQVLSLVVLMQLLKHESQASGFAMGEFSDSQTPPYTQYAVSTRA
jgi:hypothetical protein